MNKINKIEVTLEDIKEIIYSRYPDIKFQDDNILIDYTDIRFYNFSKEEMALILYYFTKHNCRICYNVIFEECLVLYKSALKKAKFRRMSLTQTSRGYDLDIFQEFPIILNYAIKTYNFIPNYSFKSYFSNLAKNHISTVIKDKYFYLIKGAFGSKSYNTYKKVIYDETLDAMGFNSYDISDYDSEDGILREIFDSKIIDIIKHCIDKNKFTKEDFEIFCKFYGLTSDSQKHKQKDLAKEYHISIPYISLKVKKVRDTLSKIQYLKELASYYGVLNE